MGGILSIHLKESSDPPASPKSPLPETIDFAENARDPNEVMECISIMDEHVHKAMTALIENDDPAKALDMAIMEIHAAFDGLLTSWISYCVTELLFRWHRERVEAMRQENDKKGSISSSSRDLRDKDAKLRVDPASLKDTIEAGRITINGARQLMGLHPISEDQLLTRKGTRRRDNMRDPNRIPIMLDDLKTLWETHPDWRLGQLIVNLSRASDIEDPFFVQDDRLLNTIKTWNACARSGR